MERPSPVPPYFWLVAPLSCSKGKKSRVINSSLMPMPVSLTANRSRTLSFFFCSCSIFRRTAPPGGVNLSALERRLMSTWFSRKESPIRAVSVMSIKGMEKATPFSTVCG